MNKPIYTILGILVLAIAGFVVLTGSNTAEDRGQIIEKEEGMAGDTVSIEDDIEIAGDCDNPELNADNPNRAYSAEVLAGNCAVFMAFNKVDYEKALASESEILIYFYANWCPICKDELKELESAFNEVAVPPNSVIGFRVNYKDNETEPAEVELARQFGITYQHTKVLLKDGQRVLKAGDSWNKERYIKEIKELANVR